MTFPEIIGSLSHQDPQEMTWIESHEMIFLCITFSLLVIWVVKEFLSIRARRMDEELIRKGMTFLFSSINNEHKDA